MPAPLRFNSTSTFGRKNWVLASTLASAALAPSVTEIQGATSLDITLIVMADGSERPSQTTNLTEDPRRLGDTNVYQNIGQTQYAGGSMTYALSTQGAAASDGKKLFERIPNGTTAFLIERLGIQADEDFAAGQFVNVYPVAFGPSQPTEVGDGESAVAGAVCTFAVTGPPAFNVAVTA